MKLKVLLAATLAVAIASPVLAGDDKAQDKSADGTAAPKEKKVCRTESVTGSLIAKRRTCMTQAQWDQLAANTGKTMGDMNRHQNLGSEGGSASGANNNSGFGF